MGKFLHKGNNFTGKLCVGKCRFESKKLKTGHVYLISFFK